MTASSLGSADYQAQWLPAEQRVSMPLLIDPEYQFLAELVLVATTSLR